MRVSLKNQWKLHFEDTDWLDWRWLARNKTNLTRMTALIDTWNLTPKQMFVSTCSDQPILTLLLCGRTKSEVEGFKNNLFRVSTSCKCCMPHFLYFLYCRIAFSFHNGEALVWLNCFKANTFETFHEKTLIYGLKKHFILDMLHTNTFSHPTDVPL